jgi:hypothetical protein
MSLGEFQEDLHVGESVPLKALGASAISIGACERRAPEAIELHTSEVVP